MQGLERFQGLTEGTSSKYLRKKSSLLVPTLKSMSQGQSDRTQALHGRLEEMLVFEIYKDGATTYHRFTVRTLHKYVLRAIRTGEIAGTYAANAKSTRNLMESLALGRAIVNGNKPGDQQGNLPTALPTPLPSASQDGQTLDPIDETEPLVADDKINGPVGQQPINEKPVDTGAVTYREKLGGFLHPRDMRKLVTPFSASNEPEFIIRRHAMLLNFDPLRTIILRDRLLVLVPDGADSILVQLERHVRGGSRSSGHEGGSMNPSESVNSLPELGDRAAETDKQNSSVTFADIPKYDNNDDSNFETLTEPSEQGGDDDDQALPNNDDDQDVQEEDSQAFRDAFIDNEWEELEGKEWVDLPFELQGVDGVLSSVSAILADDVLDLQLEANGMISELLKSKSDAGDHAQEVLRSMKNCVKEMTSRVDGFCRAIDLLLEDSEDMALMNLSRLLTHPERFVQPVPQSVLDEESDEPELILEAHLQRGHTLTNALKLVEGQITSTEEFVDMKADTIRNRLLYINVLMSTFSLAVAICALVGSLFGMNVTNHIEDHPDAFRIIVYSTCFGGFGFVLMIFGVIRWTGALPNLF